ncbi:MAG: hypothetical protein WCE35_03235, partial [Bradyrhizobium sp.]
LAGVHRLAQRQCARGRGMRQTGQPVASGAKAYGEFDAANRPSRWNTWLTAISEAAPKTATPTRRLTTK